MKKTNQTQGQKPQSVKYAAVIEYDGQGFHGWQKQNNVSTVQQAVETCLRKIFKCPDISVQASGRTDKGVHALGQVLNFSAPFLIAAENLLVALRSALAPSIYFLDLDIVDKDFHSIKSAIGKEYLYYFVPHRLCSPFFHKKISLIRGPLQWKQMVHGAELFIGEYDFSDFRCQGTEVRSTIRRVDSCHLGRLDWKTPWGNLEVIQLRIQGNGFLKQMVRLIAGCLVQLGRGQLELGDVTSHLCCPTGKAFTLAAPPDGLYLSRVFYSPPYDRWTRKISESGGLTSEGQLLSCLNYL